MHLRRKAMDDRALPHAQKSMQHHMSHHSGFSRPHRGYRPFVIVLATSLILALSACDGYRMRTDDLGAQAQIALNEARRAGAAELAAPTFAAAETRLREARQALAEDDFETARRAAWDARSLAELALVQCRTARAELELQQLQSEIAHTEAALAEESRP